MNKNTLEKLHQYQIIALDEINRICEKNNLTYFLVGGTLLGAVRHGGFIPWDDDLDVAMPREDFNEFIKISKKQLDNRFYLQTCMTSEGYYKIFAKLRINNTLFMEKDNQNANMHEGIFVDIFPLDSGTRIPKKNVVIKRKIAMGLSRNIAIRKRNQNGGLKHKLLTWIPIECMIKIREYLIKGKGDYYLNYGSQYSIEKQTIAKKHYEPAIKIFFAGKQYMAPCDYKYILSRLYGDNYMELPPIEKRVTHNPLRLSFDITGSDEILGE